MNRLSLRLARSNVADALTFVDFSGCLANPNINCVFRAKVNGVPG